MSHISTYQHVVSNVKLFCQLARDKGYKVIEEGQEVSLYGSQSVKNAQASIHITGWEYAIAINQKGQIQYDHFGSEAGSMENLHCLMQDYNEQAIIQEIPMDMVENYYTIQNKDGSRELILEYGT